MEEVKRNAKGASNLGEALEEIKIELMEGTGRRQELQAKRGLGESWQSWDVDVAEGAKYKCTQEGRKVLKELREGE